MAVNLSPVGGVAAQFFTNTGAVLTGGKLYTYSAGTTTPQAAYTSSSGATAWTNPIVLDAAGRVSGSGEIWLTDGITYKFVLKDSNDVLIATYDNVSGINSNAVSFTNQQQIITATAGQTVFNLSISYQPGTNSLSVFVDGVNQYGPGAQYAYTETDSDTVTFVSGLHVGASVKFTTTQQQGAGAVNASQVTYDPAGAGAVATNVQAKLRQTVSVKDFGAVGDDSTDNLLFFKAALLYLGTQGGGALYVPAGVYRVSSPIIVTSNIELFGDGITSQIKNSVGTYTNAGDVIHIGVSSEWVGWSNSGSAVTDATIANFDAGDYSKINASNVYVHDLHVSTSATAGTQGLGIWAVNAQNFVIENIWSTNTATPVSVANDSAIAQMACRNGVVRNVIQVTSGRWYDLVYIGDAEFIDVSGCMNNPTSNSTLNAAITIGGKGRFNRVHDNQILFQSVGSKIGVELTGESPATSTENYVYNNTIVKAGFGVVVYQMNNQRVYNNDFYSCTTAIRNYGTDTIFNGNTFTANTNDFDFKSGSNSTITNTALTFSKITGDSTALVNEQTYRNCWGFGGVKQKVYWGADYIIESADIAQVTSQGAAVQFAAGTTNLFFRIPDNLYKMQQLITYWYAGAAGEVLTQKLFKREAFANVNTWTQVGSTQTYTSSGSGDQTATWSNINATVTNVQTFQPDQYYVALEMTNANVNTQVRPSQITYLTTGTLD